MDQEQASQSPDSVCSVSERHSMEAPTPSCCTESMLGELYALRDQAKPMLDRSIQQLQHPDQLSAPLMAHFRVESDDEQRIAVIRQQVSGMRASMDATDIIYWCRDSGDPTCRNRRAAAYNCQSSSPKYVLFCGDYAFSTLGTTDEFLFGGGWLKTFIHEYAHLACSAPGGILPSGQEVYAGRNGYPPEPDVAIRNADSYANFIMNAGSSASSASEGGGLPDWAWGLIGVGAVGAIVGGILATVL